MLVVPVQPKASVPVTVYVVLYGGVQVTFDAVLLLNPVEGTQVYVEAPLTTKA
jgi:hypothetical protein